jgi:hypothetical protein
VANKQKAKDSQPVKEVAVFTKQQLLDSKRYLDKKDLINVLLEDTRLYDIDEVEDLITKFMKGKVN